MTSKGISRVESEKYTGFFVRIYRQGQTIHRSVNVSRFGGDWAAAQVEAEEQLRQMLDAHPEQERPQGRHSSVSLTFSRGAGGTGSKMPCYQVTYWVNGAQKTKDHYVHKYDDPQQAERDAYDFAKARDEDNGL